MEASVLIYAFAGLTLVASALVIHLLQRNHTLRREVQERTGELNKAVQSLKANTDRLRDLCESVPCGFHALNAAGIFIDVNETESAWLGCGRQELIGKLGFADFLDAANREKFETDFARCKVEGVCRSAEY